jgi:predicted RNase H-like HicB family nuclease
MNITAYIERDVETGMYVGIVPGIPGAHTQAENLDELQLNLKEVVELCLEEMDEESRALIPEFVGIQQVQVAA